MLNINELGITSDATLTKICKDLKIKLNYIGFEHLIYNQNYKNGGYILNIGDDTGTHWVCLNVLDKDVFYFDSFAVPPNNEVIQWCNQHNVKKKIIMKIKKNMLLKLKNTMKRTKKN